MPLLSVRDVHRRFGGIVALEGVSVDVEAGEIAGLIGPNGAGKTTLFNLISGMYTPDEGEILFAGKSVARLRPHQVARLGIGRTFQGSELFGSMTVAENVLAGAHTLGGRAGRARAAKVLEDLELARVGDQPVSSLPFGTMKRVDLGRSLASNPRLLLLDEPARGLTHAEVAELGDFLRRVRADFDVTLVVVEHHMQLVMGLCDRVHVLNFGTKIAEGSPEEVRNDEAVAEAYLGSAVSP